MLNSYVGIRQLELKPVQTPQLVAGQVVQVPAAAAVVVADPKQAVVVAQ